MYSFEALVIGGRENKMFGEKRRYQSKVRSDGVMRSFLSGLVVGVVGLIMSIFLNEIDKIIYALLVIGFIPILIAGFMSGAYVSGDRVRGNYTDPKDFYERSRRSSKLFLFGLPCVLSAIVISFIV